ncbi:unnamed protein product [Diamesa serratosioi]
MNKSETPRVAPVMGKLKDRIETNLKIRIPEKVNYITRHPSTAPTTTRVSPQFPNGSMKNHFPKNWNIDSGCDLEKDDYFVTTPGSSIADTSPIMSQFMNTASCPSMSFLKLGSPGLQDFDVSNNY